MGKPFGFAQGLSRRGMPGIWAKAQAQLWDILELRLNWVDASRPRIEELLGLSETASMEGLNF